MKHPELSMSPSSSDSVQSWLGHQLEVRGIDSIVYTRYIISLLQHDYSDQIEAKELWGRKGDSARKRDRKGEHKKKAPVTEEEKRKNAVLECLQSVSDQDCDIESLVDELCIKLKEVNTVKECCLPLSVTVHNVEGKKENKNSDVTCTQDPAQRYYAAFPALSGEDSPASISPSVFESNVWKRNPLTGQLAGETSASKDRKSPREDKTKPSTKTPEPKSKKEVFHPKKRSKSMTDGKENDRKGQKHDGKKKVYHKNSKPKGLQHKMQRVEGRHSYVHVMGWPLTTQADRESSPEEKKHKKAEAEYCNKVEQIIKTLLLSGLSDQQKIASGHPMDTEWPEWMREESISPELQENYEWYTQPLKEILAPFSKSKRLYKRHSYPPALFFDEDADVEKILGPFLSSVTSRYQFVDDVFSPIVGDSSSKTEEETSSDSNEVPTSSETSDPKIENPSEVLKTETLKVNPLQFSLTYSSDTTGEFSLFKYVDDNEKPEALKSLVDEKQKRESWHGFPENTQKSEETQLQESWHGLRNEETQLQESWHGLKNAEKQLQESWHSLRNEEKELKESWHGLNNAEKQMQESWHSLRNEESQLKESWLNVKPEETQLQESWHSLRNEETQLQEPWLGFPENGLRNEEISHSELYSVWNNGQNTEGGGVMDAASLVDLYDISSCSTRTFDSDEGTEMSDFEGIFTFDLDSDEESISTPVKQVPHQSLDYKLQEASSNAFDASLDIHVPEDKYLTDQLFGSFSAVLGSPKNSGVCSMLIDRQYLTEMMQMDLENHAMSLHSPFTPSICYNIWSVDEGSPQSCWQSKVLLHEFLQTFDDECRVTSVPWESVLGDSALRWNLTPKDECEKLCENSKSGRLSQLWDVNSQRKLPWFSAFWNLPHNLNIWANISDHVEEDDDDRDWQQGCWPVDKYESEAILSQGVIDEDAIIGIELLEELDKETSRDDIRRSLSSWERSERSVSDSDIHNTWSKHHPAKPEFHRSFELIPSETSAFTDVVPCKMPHVRSAPNLKYSSMLAVLPSGFDDRKGRPGDISEQRNDSPTEHLYFSNKTHFRPIQTPVGTPHDALDQRGDLFGDFGVSTGTPYQQFSQPGSEEEKLPMFRPKFKVQKDLDKYIQTGRSLDDGYDPKLRSQTKSFQESGCLDDSRFDVGKGQTTGDLIDVAGDGEDPFGKESGFESNGEVEDSILIPKESDEENDLEECEWADGTSLASKFSHLYLDGSESLLPKHLSDLWKEKKSTDAGAYTNAWSSGYECEESDAGKYGDYAHYLQYLPLVKDGELTFSQSSANNHHQDLLHQVPGTKKKPAFGSNQQDLSGRIPEKDNKSFFGRHLPESEKRSVFHGGHLDCGKEEETPGAQGDPRGEKSGPELNDVPYVWNGDGFSDKTVEMLNPYAALDYKTCGLEDTDYPVNSIPNSVDELSQYYLGQLAQDTEDIPYTEATHELMHPHGFDMNFIPKVPMPESAVYSCELEGEEMTGREGLVPLLPNAAVYSCDLEKEWLDPHSRVQMEWPPYLNVPNARRKGKNKPKGSNRKPCSFFLEGSCKRADCKFSHDISTITCRFWEDGMCFKGPLCPFLHGYYVMSDSDSNSIDSMDLKFELKREEFPELGLKREVAGKFHEKDEKLKTQGKGKEKKRKIISTKVHKG